MASHKREMDKVSKEIRGIRKLIIEFGHQEGLSTSNLLVRRKLGNCIPPVLQDDLIYILKALWLIICSM